MTFVPALRAAVVFFGSLFLDGRSDLAAAYSMRRLLAPYTGPFVRVRRSSDSAEQDFGTGAASVSWGDVLAFIGAGSGFVSKWYDQSGNGRDLAQSTAASQPQIGLLSNGLPGFTTDGSNDFMTTVAFTQNQLWSFSIVFRLVASGTTKNFFDGLTADRGTFFQGGTGEQLRLYAGSQFATDATSVPTGTRGVASGLFNGASSRLELSGAALASYTGDAGANNLDGLTLGTNGSQTAARFINAEYQELIAFSGAAAQADLQARNVAMRSAWRF